MSKGILNIGCSYTWGEGLYYYSDLDNLPLKEKHEFDPRTVTPAMMLFKDTKRFANLVANYYNTWYWVEMGNGGSNMLFVEYIKNNLKNRDKFNPSDFALVIYQFTHFTRDLKMGISVDDQIDAVNECLTEFENNNIKVISFCWDEEIPSQNLYRELFKHRHMDIEIDGITKPAFDYFVWNDEFNITIQSDFKERGLQKNDLHFNTKGHQIIADLIIKKLEQDNFTL